jgi:hypothetical protein
MVAGIKSEPWPASNRYPRPACVGIRSITTEMLTRAHSLVLKGVAHFVEETCRFPTTFNRSDKMVAFRPHDVKFRDPFDGLTLTSDNGGTILGR